MLSLLKLSSSRRLTVAAWERLRRVSSSQAKALSDPPRGFGSRPLSLSASSCGSCRQGPLSAAAERMYGSVAPRLQPDAAVLRGVRRPHPGTDGGSGSGSGSGSGGGGILIALLEEVIDGKRIKSKTAFLRRGTNAVAGS